MPRPARAQSSEDSLREEIEAKLRTGQLDGAVEQARAAIEHYPRSPLLYQLLGAALFKQGANEEARKAFERAIALDPSVPQTYFDLGW